MLSKFTLSMAEEQQILGALRRRGILAIRIGQRLIAIRTVLTSTTVRVRVRDITEREDPEPPVLFKAEGQPSALLCSVCQAIEAHINELRGRRPEVA